MVGPGGGKSALISALLGEMHGCDAPDGTPARLGAPVIAGTTSYVAQVAWVQSLSLKDNVLFGRALDEDALPRVGVRVPGQRRGAVAPGRPDGDRREGHHAVRRAEAAHRHRARAVYADADLVVMDDL